MAEQESSWRQWLHGRAGKIVVIVAILSLLVWAGTTLVGFFRRSPTTAANDWTFVCSETGKAFTHTIQVGETLPVHSPFSGKDTGYPATACWWTADGQIKTEPTWVVLNSTLRKPGPTFCPDCGRLVLGRSPKPHPGDRPPPTRDEYYAMHPNDPRN